MANEFKVKNGIKFPDDTIQTTAATGGGSTVTFNNRTAAYTVVAGDLGKVINCTSGTFIVSLTAAATLGSGFNCWVWNNSTTTADTITIDPNLSETIDGETTLVLRPGEGTQIICDGTNWQTGSKKSMRLYAENHRSTSSEARPVASGQDSVAIGAGTNSVGTRSVALGTSYASGEDSFAAAIGNGTSTYGAKGIQSIAMGANSTASGASAVAIGSLTSATSSYSSAIGGNSASQGSQAVTGSGAVALGGSYASGSDSFAAAVANNTSTYGATAANNISLGYLSKSTGTATTAIGYTANSSGSYATAIGYGAVASGSNAVAIGGWWSYGAPTSSAISSIAIGDGVTANANWAVALGSAAITNTVKGKYAYSNGRFAANGDSQTGIYVLRRATTNSTATVLTTDDTAPSTDDQIILPNNTAFVFSGMVVARQQASGGTASAAWKVDGLIRREGSAGTTALVNSALTVISNVPGWTLALSADTTNGGLAVTVTGAAATNIRWVANIQTSEVTYA